MLLLKNFKKRLEISIIKEKIIATGVEYNPVEITVFDTLNNEWLIVLMRYFSSFVYESKK